jgi:uncharacterized protein
MRKNFLRPFVTFSLKNPMTILIIVGVLTIASICSVLYLQIETDINSLLPADSKVNQTLQRSLETFKSFDFAVVVLETEDEKQAKILIDAADALYPALDNPAYVYSVDYRIEPDLWNYYLGDVESRLVCLLNKNEHGIVLSRFAPIEMEKQIKRLSRRLQCVISPRMKRNLLEDPLDLARIFQNRLVINQGPACFPLHRGHYLSYDDKTLLMILRPLESASDLKFSTDLMIFLDRVRNVIIEKNSKFSDRVKVSFWGSHVETVANTRIVKRDMLITIITSFIGVLLLFFLVFRHKIALLFVGLPLFIGILWTLGLTQLVLGHLTVVTFAFGAVLIGLGIDFAIHIYNRFLEERRRSGVLSVYKALHIALVKTGEGVLLGALTTAVAFFSMFFTSFRGFRELGFVAGSGIICCLFSIFMLFPILVRYVIPKSLPENHREITSFALPRVFKMLREFPRLVIIIGLVMTAYFAWQARSVRFDENFAALKQHSSEYTELIGRLKSRFPLASHQIIAIVSDSTLQGVLEKNDRLYENLIKQEKYPILSSDSLRNFLPSVKSQKESKQMIRETIGNRLDETTARLLHQGKEAGLSPKVLQPLIERLKLLTKSASDENNLLLYEDLRHPFMIRLVQGYLAKQEFFDYKDSEYKVITRIFPPAGQWEAGVPQGFFDLLSEGVGSVEFTGVSIVADEIQKTVKRDLAFIMLLVIGSVSFILVLYFRGFLKTLFAVFPVVCGSIWMLGTMCIFGIELNFLNVIVIPMIIGVGVDNGIHLMLRYCERKDNPDMEDLRLAVVMTGRSLVMTSLTTIVGFGSLILADFRGIREMGILSIFGIAYTLIASLVFLPAILTIWGRRHRLSDIIGREDDGEIR